MLPGRPSRCASRWPGWTRRSSTITRSESTRLNSSHTVIYTLSLHDALPICTPLINKATSGLYAPWSTFKMCVALAGLDAKVINYHEIGEHTSELQSHSDLHSFPTRRSSDLHPVDQQSDVRAVCSLVDLQDVRRVGRAGREGHQLS